MIRHKILVVDDEPDIVDVIHLRLVQQGYEVITAYDGLQATRRVVLDKPDLIILDIGLPAGSGLVVAQRLRQSCPSISTPIIFLTARTTPEDFFQAMNMGAARYLTKPFDMDELLATVAEMIKIRQEEKA